MGERVPLPKCRCCDKDILRWQEFKTHWNRKTYELFGTCQMCQEKYDYLTVELVKKGVFKNETV